MGNNEARPIDLRTGDDARDVMRGRKQRGWSIATSARSKKVNKEVAERRERVMRRREVDGMENE